MSRWLRSAEMNRNLVIGLAAIILIAGGFWVWKLSSTSGEKTEIAQEFAREYYTLYDNETGKTYELPAEEAKQLEMKEGWVKVPETGKFTGSWGGPRAGSVIDTGGDEP